MYITESNVYEVYLKDDLVAKIDISDGTVTVKEKAPLDLPLIENPKTISERVQNIAIFKEWCASRTLMMSQKHAKKICNALNLSQENSIDNKAGIALAYNGSTLSDAYWVKKHNSNLTFADTSLYKNTSRNILTPVSLRGEVDSVFTKKLKNWSDIGADGTLAKSWIRKDNYYYLEKAGDNIEGEILASDILESMNANAISYKKTENETLSVSECKCFTTEDISFIPYRTFAKKYGLDAIKKIKKSFLTDYANMTISTYLIGNEDLHDKNWGLLMDNDSGKIIGLAPLFDFDGCFLNYNNSKDLLFLPETIFVMENGEKRAYHEWNMDEEYELMGPTIEIAAAKYAKYSTLDYHNIDMSLIPEKYKEEFERRITYLEKQKDFDYEKN